MAGARIGAAAAVTRLCRAILTVAAFAIPSCAVEAESFRTREDYPIESLRNYEQGDVHFILDVDATGTVTACRIEQSSGYPRLDEASCSMLVRRARFKPAVDDNGKPVPSTYRSVVRWRIPG